jgi:hypothetical protein
MSLPVANYFVSGCGLQRVLLPFQGIANMVIKKETVKSGTTGRRITPKNQLFQCRGHPRRSFFRPRIQSWNPATGCGANSASGYLAGEFEKNKTQPFHPRRDHQYRTVCITDGTLQYGDMTRDFRAIIQRRVPEQRNPLLIWKPKHPLTSESER